MSKVTVIPRETPVSIPQGFPKARLDSVVKRATQLAEQIKAVGETIASVEISPDGSVRILTTAGAGLASRHHEWD